MHIKSKPEMRLYALAILFCYCINLMCVFSPSGAETERKTGRVETATHNANVLFIGVELEDLTEKDRERYIKYRILERSYQGADEVKKLVKQARPVAIVIKQPSGTMYEYAPDGTMIKTVKSAKEAKKEEEKKKKEEQIQQAGDIDSFNVPTKVFSGGFSALSPSTGCSTGALVSPYFPMPQPCPETMTQGSVFGAIPFPMPVMMGMVDPNMMNSSANSMSGGTSLSGQMNGSMSGNNINYVSPDNTSKPFPGANVSESLYPGTAEYSFLPGEGDFLAPPGISLGRQTLKQLTSLVQQNAYPFWFDNQLTTDTSVINSLGGSNTSFSGGFPTLQINSNTTANAAVVGSQLLGNGVGIGATVFDAVLEGRELKARRAYADAYANGTPYYQYPQQSRTYYSAMRYQPYPVMPSTAY
jgi:hypothetical protein